jgi:hypothetical protein
MLIIMLQTIATMLATTEMPTIKTLATIKDARSNRPSLNSLFLTLVLPIIAIAPQLSATIEATIAKTINPININPTSQNIKIHTNSIHDKAQ